MASRPEIEETLPKDGEEATLQEVDVDDDLFDESVDIFLTTEVDPDTTDLNYSGPNPNASPESIIWTREQDVIKGTIL